MGSNRLNHRRLQETRQTLGHATGKHWGTLPANPEFAEKAIERGCRLLSIGADVLMMRRGIESIKDTFPKYF